MGSQWLLVPCWRGYATTARAPLPALVPALVLLLLGAVAAAGDAQPQLLTAQPNCQLPGAPAPGVLPPGGFACSAMRAECTHFDGPR